VERGDRQLLASPAAAARVVRTARRIAAADETQLRVLRAGLCGTDVQIATGRRPDVASILGHEGIAVPLDAEGGAVVFNPVHAVDQDQILGHSYDGLFQDVVTVRRSERGGPDLCSVDPELTADLAPLIEPLATVLYSHELLAAGGAPWSLAVIGAGTTAVLHALVAAEQGVEVHLVHRRAERGAWLYERLLTSGAALHAGLPEAGARIRAARGGAAVDAAVICMPRAGAPAALEQALGCVCDGGVVNLFGGFRPGDRHPLLPIVDLGAVRRANVRGLPRPAAYVAAEAVGGAAVRLTGQRGTSVAHLLEAQRRLVAAPDVFAPVVTAVVSLEGLAGELRALGADGDRPRSERCKVVVDLTLPADGGREVDLGRRVADVA
jgi:threonine dehydrogenase-like Zn-dependent dehydrogenase